MTTEDITRTEDEEWEFSKEENLLYEERICEYLHL